MDAPAVRLVGVHRAFGPVAALQGLSLVAEHGAITALLGPNGAGKTSALRIITGALVADAGDVAVFGLDPTGPDGAEVRRRCGVVAAKPALYDRLTGRDNLHYAADLYGMNSHEAVSEAAARFGIENALDLRVGGYSTGMKTRLALARALLHSPDMLLLDEPTSGLDPESAHAVLNMLRETAAAGTAVVLCTHLLLEAEGLADVVVLLDAGREVATGTPRELAEAYLPGLAVTIDAENRDMLDSAASFTGVVSYERNGGAARIEVASMAHVPDVVSSLCAAGARLTEVTPWRPSLEELYFEIRKTNTGLGSNGPLSGPARASHPG